MVFQAVDQPTSKSTNKVQLAVDDNVWGMNQSSIDRALEAILNWTNDSFGKSLFVKAKNDFYWKNGKVFHEDDFYSSRMSYFLDIFIFQNKIGEWINNTEEHKTLFTNFLESKKECVIHKHRHSLFKVKQINENSLKIVDLFDNNQIQVTKRKNETFFGIKRKEIFQGFVYECKNKSYLSLGLVFHPSGCIPIISTYLKEIKKAYAFDKNAVLSRFARLQIRHKRHHHVDPKIIYTEDHR